MKHYIKRTSVIVVVLLLSLSSSHAMFIRAAVSKVAKLGVLVVGAYSSKTALQNTPAHALFAVPGDSSSANSQVPYYNQNSGAISTDNENIQLLDIVSEVSNESAKGSLKEFNFINSIPVEGQQVTNSVASDAIVIQDQLPLTNGSGSEIMEPSAWDVLVKKVGVLLTPKDKIQAKEQDISPVVRGFFQKASDQFTQKIDEATVAFNKASAMYDNPAMFGLDRAVLQVQKEWVSALAGGYVVGEVIHGVGSICQKRLGLEKNAVCEGVKWSATGICSTIGAVTAAYFCDKDESPELRKILLVTAGLVGVSHIPALARWSRGKIASFKRVTQENEKQLLSSDTSRIENMTSLADVSLII